MKVKPAGSQKRTQKAGKNLRLEFFPDFQQRHSRAGGKQIATEDWFPACAGMTRIAVLAVFQSLFRG
ncbi:MAG: hypothetical protein ACI93T_003925 [Porticoccaceae bacterium]